MGSAIAGGWAVAQRVPTAVAIVVVAAAAALALGVARRGKGEGARCGPGFVARDARCRVLEATGPERCPAPLVTTPGGCDAPDVRILIPAAAIAVGPSDWEAEGRVLPRSIRVRAFRIDAFEVTLGHWSVSAPEDDAARAASGMTRAEAAAFCAGRGGRLPTEDEWIVAAASAMNPPRRYPWGDTGAVCRRGAWGLTEGPCAYTADGPDTVGAHPDGDSPLGLHDLAGNVAEWVAPAESEEDATSELASRSRPSGSATAPTLDTSHPPTPTPASAPAIAKGGSWRAALASDLRLWSRLELPPTARDPRVGFRCAYPP
jgi:formylglycine-generating enzyme required for sulfatase activity